MKERETVLGETRRQKTEAYTDQETGATRIRTVEVIEKTIEHEVGADN